MGIEFTDILKNLIVEESREKFLLQKYTEPKIIDGITYPPTMDSVTFYNIVGYDPTTRTNDVGGIKVGSYSQWLLNYYVDKIPESCIDLGYEFGTRSHDECTSVTRELFLEDLYKVKEDLTKFDRFKHRIDPNFRDINRIQSPDHLFDLVGEFTLVKKPTKKEKEQGKVNYEYPGSEIVFKGQNWVIIKISDKGQLGKSAARFFGGYHEYDMGETRWCTSWPDSRMFNKYIKQGPLYVLLPTQSSELSEKTGLPIERYQFHFHSDQFKDRHDHEIDLIGFMNQNPEIKTYFKDIFIDYVNEKISDRVVITYPKDSQSKLIKLYGFDTLIDSLPDTLLSFIFNNTEYGITLDIPEKFCKFKGLKMLSFNNSIKSLPNCIVELNNLKLLALENNPELTSLPENIGNMKNLTAINLNGSGIDETNLPESLKTNPNNISIIPFNYE